MPAPATPIPAQSPARGAGRFAPSPTGELHLGNLRTALVAWLSARSQGLRFIVRMEDLDRVTSSRQHEKDQLSALAELGLDWDGDVVRQSERFDLYERVMAQLTEQGRTYECFCTRREIREAASAPHGEQVADGAYTGRCLHLRDVEREALVAQGRRPALRLRAESEQVTISDDLHGSITAVVDDVVLRRNDGVPAYNLAVVVDDAAQGVTEVVRGADLLSSTPRQVLLQRLLGYPTPRYRHVPLAVNARGDRLAKRDGAVTLRELGARGLDPPAVLHLLASSLGWTAGSSVTLSELLARFDPATLPVDPWVVAGDLSRS